MAPAETMACHSPTVPSRSSEPRYENLNSPYGPAGPSGRKANSLARQGTTLSTERYGAATSTS